MEFKTQTNQPAAQPAAQPVAHVTRPSGNGGPVDNGGKGRKLIATVLGAVVVLALVLAGLFLLMSQKGGQDAAVDKNKFQAVFMTNGQVYFGHLSSTEGEYVELSDIYYLQVQQDVQPSTGTNNQQGQQNANSQVSLTKLGSELHGPTDKMNISKDQVLFWEDLKDDSSVVKAINDHKNKQ